MLKVLVPPENLSEANKYTYRIFLAGSIEMGVAEKWQDTAINYFNASSNQYNPYDTVVFNPRRVNWNPSWEQTIENGQFYRQVSWELQAMEVASHVLMYFDPNTKSPISLLELGLNAISKNNQLYVVCPEGFWRKGNVDIVCEYYRIKQYQTLDGALQAIRTYYGSLPGTPGTSGISGAFGHQEQTDTDTDTQAHNISSI